MFSLMSLRSKRSTSTRLGAYDAVAIRLARAEDESAIRRIAALDGKEAPTGRVLVAEADSELIAARAIAGGAAVADPFRWTSEVVALMEMRAKQLVDAEPRAMPAPAGGVQALRTQTT